MSAQAADQRVSHFLGHAGHSRGFFFSLLPLNHFPTFSCFVFVSLFIDDCRYDEWKSISWLAVDDTLMYSNRIIKSHRPSRWTGNVRCTEEITARRVTIPPHTKSNRKPVVFLFCLSYNCVLLFGMFSYRFVSSFLSFICYRKNWTWLHPTGRRCWHCRRKRNGKSTATGKRLDATPIRNQIEIVDPILRCFFPRLHPANLLVLRVSRSRPTAFSYFSINFGRNFDSTD